MDYSFTQETALSLEQLLENTDGSRLLEGTSRAYLLLESPSIAKFAYKIAVVSILNDPESFEHVRTIYHHQCHLLHFQQIFGDLVVDQLNINDLDCHFDVLFDSST